MCVQAGHTTTTRAKGMLIKNKKSGNNKREHKYLQHFKATDNHLRMLPLQRASCVLMSWSALRWGQMLCVCVSWWAFVFRHWKSSALVCWVSYEELDLLCLLPGEIVKSIFTMNIWGYSYGCVYVCECEHCK